MEGLGEHGEERVKYVTSKLGKLQGIFEAPEGEIKASILEGNDKWRESIAPEKLCQLVEARPNKAKREIDESI